MSAVMQVQKSEGRECVGVNCVTVVTLKCGRYCDPCRSKVRRKKLVYVPNDFIDQRLKKIYSETPDLKAGRGSGIHDLAKTSGWPRYALRQRARRLGLARTKDTPWTDKEIRLLERFAWMSDKGIQLKLKAAGFQRTATAIHIKLTRTSARLNHPYFTATALAGLMGIDSHVVTRWINLGYLPVTAKGSDRHAGNGGDMKMIHENDVRKFILARPMEFDIRKVDQLWFLDLITEGKIAAL